MNLMVRMERGLVHAWTSTGRIAAFVGVCLFAVAGFAAESISIAATPRYPWNGKVDLKFTIDGTSGTKYDTSFTAKDVVGNTNLTMKTLYKSNGTAANVAKEQLLPGTYNWVWDATADLGEGTVLEKVVVEGKAAEQSTPVITSGLVAWWPFNGDLEDHSGNAHHLSGTVSYTADRNGTKSTAATFTGSSFLTQKTDLGVSGAMTFCCWVNNPTYTVPRDDIEMYLAAVGAGSFGHEWVYWPMIVFPVSHSSGRGIGFSVAANRIDVFAYGKSPTGSGLTFFDVFLDYSCTFSSGWHHIAVTVATSSAPILYVDGVKVKTGSTAWNGVKVYLNSGSTVGGGNVYINNKANARNYKGNLDDLCIYNRVLSDSEIKQLYQAK